jgi:nitric oxide reductase NorQ protein
MDKLAARLPAGDALPFYKPQGNEVSLFEYAFRHQLPMLIKGPTGCGKTRFVQFIPSPAMTTFRPPTWWDAT